MTIKETRLILSQDIHFLGDILGQVIRRQAGIEVFELVERMRALSKARRIDDDPAIGARIADLVSDLETADCELLARSFAIYFELINLAEEQYRVQVLRERERSAYPLPLKESIPSAIAVTHASDCKQPCSTSGGTKSSAAQAEPTPQPPCGPPVKNQVSPLVNGNCNGGCCKSLGHNGSTV